MLNIYTKHKKTYTLKYFERLRSEFSSSLGVLGVVGSAGTDKWRSMRSDRRIHC